MSQSTPFHLTELDRQLLAMSDEEFVAHDWDDLKDIIGEILLPSSSHDLPTSILYQFFSRRASSNNLSSE